MTFTHRRAARIEETFGLSGASWGGDADRAKVAADVDAVKAWSDAHHRPIFLGQFGAYERGDIQSRMRYDAAVARACDMAADEWVEPILHALVPPHDADKP